MKIQVKGKTRNAISCSLLGLNRLLAIFGLVFIVAYNSETDRTHLALALGLRRWFR